MSRSIEKCAKFVGVIHFLRHSTPASMPRRFKFVCRPVKKMDTATVLAVISVAFIGAAVGGTVRAVLATYMAPWGCNEVVAPEAAVQSSQLPAVSPVGPPHIELAPVSPHSVSVTTTAINDAECAGVAPQAAAAATVATTALNDADSAGMAPQGAGSVALTAARSLAETGSTSPCVGDFPAATFTANIVGCFILGLLTQLSVRLAWPPYVLAALGTGFCGGLTTMSSFIVDTLKLIYAKNGGTAAIYWVSTQAACMLAGWIGWLLGTLAPIKQVAP